MDYKKILEDIYAEVKPLLNKGKVADYIPALSQVPIDKYGIVVRLNSGEEFCFGDYEENFSIQSISKLLTLTMAHTANTQILNKFVGVEPSGNPFNSLVQLEYEDGIPRNPFINAGALVITDNLISLNPDAKCQILNTFRDLSGNNNIQVDPVVEKSEQEHGYRNLALVNFMKSFGNIKNDVNKVVDVYFNHCSIAMNCLDLARTFSFLSNGGKSITGETITTVSQTKRINSIMLTCGTYDAVGKFVFEVGLPAKSGVGGGIVAIHPGKFCVAVWSPKLNANGNSYKGMKVLEAITTKTQSSIF